MSPRFNVKRSSSVKITVITIVEILRDIGENPYCRIRGQICHSDIGVCFLI